MPAASIAGPPIPSPHAGRVLVYLQALRGIAASAVIVDHAMDGLIARGLLSMAWQQAAWLSGWIGVAVFFAISGFIMIRTSRGDFGCPGIATTFLRRRIIRVVPLYWVATAIYVVLRGVTGAWVQPDALIRSLAFIPYRAGAEPVMRPIVGQGWTLNYEMLFYLAFAACLLLSKRVGVAVLLAAFPLVVLAGSMVRPLFPYSDPLTPLAFWTDPIILQFGWGIVVGLAASDGNRPARLGWPVLVSVALMALIVVTFVQVGGRFPLSFPWQLGIGVVCAAIVWLCVHMVPVADGGALRCLERVGDASFSTYLFHPIVLTMLFAITVRVPVLGGHPVLVILAALLGCNAAGYGVSMLLERPLLEIGRTWTSRRYAMHRDRMASGR